jgi:MoaA/NifB/PqqE/SkfB family radical SAM enzyme
VVTDLRQWLGRVHVFLSGGEALLKPFAADLAAYASSRGLLVEFLTHGYWQDQLRIEELALARPWRVTISLDGLDETHDLIRGRQAFFDKTMASILTLQRVRKKQRLGFTIRLKTVIMEQNLESAHKVAWFANQDGMEVFYQPIEQNYNTPEDSRWFEHSETWPRDSEKAVAAVSHLIQLKRAGLPIANSFAQLDAMTAYFRDPVSSRVITQSHSAHERETLCSALTMLQIEADGDVRICAGMPPVGNIKKDSIRRIWENRPRFWESGCCIPQRCSEEERIARSLAVLPM